MAPYLPIILTSGVLFRNDIRTNENSRRNQDSMFTNKLDTLKQKQEEHGETLIRLNSGIKV